MRKAAKEFLASAGWIDSAVSPVAGDLSDRSYVRLVKGDDTAILMDAGGDAASTNAFAGITEWLHMAGASAPQIFHADTTQGLMLLEDFGDVRVSALMGNRNVAHDLFDTIIDLLLHLRMQPVPNLSRPDATQLCEWTRIADEFYPGADIDALDAFRTVLEPVLGDILADGLTTSLRDFHTENMMWLPSRDGIRRIGLLDYQDAFLTHPAYDLVSLLTDARTDVPKSLCARSIARYLKGSGDDPNELGRAFAALSAQRNLRILGIFHRSAQLSGKTHHLPKIPRVLGHVREALEHPMFDTVRDDVIAGLPEPEAAV